MLQYIINTSIIWLACVLLYELMLRKESFHQYNRIFLLASIVAGLLLPALTIKGWGPVDHSVLQKPRKQVYQVSQKIAGMTRPEMVKIQMAAPQSQPQQVVLLKKRSPFRALWAIYVTGLLAGAVLVTREIFLIVRLYRQGSKTREAGCVVVETGGEHSPFSFFKIVFVGSRERYEQPQWTLLMQHEREHGRLLHSLDNLALICLRIVCWFHPLPHIYHKRLLLIHEYQADSAVATDTKGYGSFLLEQGLLRCAPMLTHSFNYSPIKNRIAMLTSAKSTRRRLLKYLAVGPLSLLLVLFCTQRSFSGEGNSELNKVYFKGNEIRLEALQVVPTGYMETLERQKAMFMNPTLPDSVPVKQFPDGLMKMERVMRETVPVAINGQTIFGDEPRYIRSLAEANYVPPGLHGGEKDLYKFLFSNLREDLNKLNDGSYQINVGRLVVNEKGTIAYYESPGVGPVYGENAVVSEDAAKNMSRKISALLDGPIRFRPALKNGVPVNGRLQLDGYEIEVKNHAAILLKKQGC